MVVLIPLQANTIIRRAVGDREGLGLSEHVQNPTEVQASSPLIPTRSGMEGRLVLPSLKPRSPQPPVPGAQSPSVCRIAGNRFRLSPSCTRSPGSGNSGSFLVIYRRPRAPTAPDPRGELESLEVGDRLGSRRSGRLRLPRRPLLVQPPAALADEIPSNQT